MTPLEYFLIVRNGKASPSPSKYTGIIASILLFLNFDLANSQNHVKLIGEVIDNRIEEQKEMRTIYDENIKADIDIGSLQFDCTTELHVLEVLFINSKGTYGLFLLQ